MFSYQIYNNCPCVLILLSQYLSNVILLTTPVQNKISIVASKPKQTSYISKITFLAASYFNCLTVE